VRDEYDKVWYTNFCSSPLHVHRKIKREVIEKEKEAFEGRRVQSLFKLIERKKVQHNLYEFVRHSCKRFREARSMKTAEGKHQQPHQKH